MDFRHQSASLDALASVACDALLVVVAGDKADASLDAALKRILDDAALREQLKLEEGSTESRLILTSPEEAGQRQVFLLAVVVGDAVGGQAHLRADARQLLALHSMLPGAEEALWKTLELSYFARHDAGDHQLFIGRVLHVIDRGLSPLVFNAGRYHLVGEIL